MLTGEPGTGKTQAAYYMVRYFRDAHVQNADQQQSGEKKALDRSKYIEKRALWLVFEKAKKKGMPQVLLIDEIDKASRDFPNDLLHELDQMEFTILETG